LANLFEPSISAAAREGPKKRNPAPRQEGYLRTTEHQIGLFGLGQGDQLGGGFRADLGQRHPALPDAAPQGFDAWIARRSDQSVAQRALQQFPRQGVLAPARTDKQYSIAHGD
jgi:hypothetical protein